MTGSNIFVSVQEEPIDMNNLNDFLNFGNSCGAVFMFVGKVRNDSVEGQSVKSLRYTAYQPMAERVIEKIVANVIGQSENIKRICVIHRIGNVDCNSASLVIGISAVRSLDTFDRLQVILGEIKTLVPIWKENIFNHDS